MIQPHTACKIHSVHLNIPESLNPLVHQLKSRMSFKSHQLKSPIISSCKLSKLGTCKAIRIIDIRAKLLFVYGSVKLEKKLFASIIQWWDKHGIIIIGIAIQKGRKRKEKRSYWSQAIIESNQTYHFCFKA